jgi:hypothetical protein
MQHHIWATIAFLFLSLAVGGCAEDRYAYNMRRAHVTQWTHLSPADHSEIVRLVSAATEEGIQAISTCMSRSEQIFVFTGFSEAGDGIGERFRWHEFVLEKHSGRWQIVSHDSISPTVARIFITYPPC